MTNGMELITEEQERTLLQKLKAYYERLYPDIRFNTREEKLSRDRIAETYYTYSGEESQATFEEKTRAISKALKYGYNTPVILLRAGGNDYLLDGHRRLKVAWDNGLQWPALVLEASRDANFGIKKLVQGRLRDAWRKP